MDLMPLEVLSHLNECVADSGIGTALWKGPRGQAGPWAGISLSSCSEAAAALAPLLLLPKLCVSCEL